MKHYHDNGKSIESKYNMAVFIDYYFSLKKMHIGYELCI